MRMKPFAMEINQYSLPSLNYGFIEMKSFINLI